MVLIQEIMGSNPIGSEKFDSSRMRKVLASGFFDRPTLRVAKELLGKFLVRRFPRRSASGLRKSASREAAAMIIEVEAYIGFHDLASHASRGKTARNTVMFGRAGVWYVYFTYGMHWMLNIVTGPKGYPAAVLIRGIEGIPGPARVTKYFKVDRRMNLKPASRKTGLWIEDRGARIPKSRMKRGMRIGVDYAGSWKRKLWRFYVV